MCEQPQQPRQLAGRRVADRSDQNEPADALRMAGGDLPCDGSSERIADEGRSRDVELVKKAHNQLGHMRPTIALLRIGTGQSVTGQI
jgi:hypothetical protein